MNLDEELRHTLHSRAEQAPGGTDALARFQQRTGRYQVRQRLALTSAAVAAAAAVAVGAPYLLAASRPAPPVGAGALGPSLPGSATAGSPSPSATASRPSEPPSRVRFGPPEFLPVTFPLTPGWVPPGLGTPVVDRTAGAIRLVYFGTGTNLIVTVSAQAEAGAEKTRRLPDGRVVSLESGGTVPADQLARYAAGLAVRAYEPGPLPVGITSAPLGYRLDFLEQDPTAGPANLHLCIAPKSDVDSAGATLLCLVIGSDVATGDGEPVQVGGDPGKIIIAGDFTDVVVTRAGVTYMVHASTAGPLNRTDLIRYADAIHPA